MFNPVSTYRIQFHKDFNFKHFKEAIPYLIKLGVSTIYASPIFEAVPGSVHGYDCINPLGINPEIGTEEELIEISGMLKDAGIGWLQDIVPNHMAYHTNNPWLADVLRNGKESEYAVYFDINWEEGKLMCPFLGSDLANCIADGSLKLDHDKEKPVLKYYDSAFPISEGSYVDIQAEYDMGRSLAQLNRDVAFLKKIVDQQHYRLCHWQETDEHINYRRFFLVNGLICLNIQHESVFDHYHRYIKKLLDKGIFQGLRVDHIDGLYEPVEYLHRLRRLAGPDVFIVVEKILGHEEQLSKDWPVQGTTGYNYLAQVNNLLTYVNAGKEFKKLYEKIIPGAGSVQEQVWEKKAHILFSHMNGELNMLTKIFLKAVPEASAINLDKLRRAIAAMLIHWPVYRHYANAFPLPEEEHTVFQQILKSVRKEQPELDDAVIMIKQAFENTDKYNAFALLHFYRRCMQYAGPLMAKGVEDTLMYTYNAFIGHNEVGDGHEVFGINVDTFHQRMLQRQKEWPLELNATATHDTKRGEDARARLNVITEIPDEWKAIVKEWNKIAETDKEVPDGNERYMVYQALLGAYSSVNHVPAVFLNRVEEYLQKALREAKTHSSWHAPDEIYEQKVKAFAARVLDNSGPYHESFQRFFKRIEDYGIVNSLSQVLLKFTCPGVPDVYQGCESWDLSFVDPDNRKPVDYKAHAVSLDNNEKESMEQLWSRRHTSDVKIGLVKKLLWERRKRITVFSNGDYIPLKVKGKYKEHIIAYARHYGYTWYITVAPLHLAVLNRKQSTDLSGIDWADTNIELPKDMPEKWTNVLTDAEGKAKSKLFIKDIFKEFPVALLRFENQATEREAGILLAISSLPAAFGIGDIGSTAKMFADFLYGSGQRVWQLLPVTPTDGSSNYSPYSSYSSMACFDLLIDPLWLASKGLIDKDIVKQYQVPETGKAAYDEAKRVKDILFHFAWQSYCEDDKGMGPAFHRFCEAEKHWLEDHSLYTLLKARHDGASWSQWPEPYKGRDYKVLQEFIVKEEKELSKIKWLQFVFSLQWQELKQYCNDLGIKLFGDIPFYISADSADVWANPGIFNVNKEGNFTVSAGVPPDYFSEDGQLWGMPTYKWDVLKTSNYEWWVKRLRRSFDQFDMLRIDHFRALSEYWEVPAGEKTAVNGEWKKGHGPEFFKVIREQLGDLPLIAEDLGDNMDKVYKLREDLGLPGMKVLQFAFGEHMSKAVDAPHNYSTNFVVYTGTHDNNTIKGWYRQEIKKEDRKRINEYTGVTVTEKNVHLVLGKLAYSTVAKTAILPMQDVLGLDETHRMNIPGDAEGNWMWRLKPGYVSDDIVSRLKKWTVFYNRL